MAGLEQLDFSVTFNKDKTTVQAKGVIDCKEGWMQELKGILLTDTDRWLHLSVHNMPPARL